MFTSEQGRGASAEGNRPFVDVLDLETRETERLWRSQPPHYESTGGSQMTEPPPRTTHRLQPDHWPVSICCMG